MQGARPNAQHAVMLTRVGWLWVFAFALASGAAPILGPWPRAKQCVAFRRHAEFDQKVTPKTGPFFGTKCHTGYIQKLTDQRAKEQEYQDSWQDFLALAGVPPQPLGMKV